MDGTSPEALARLVNAYNPNCTAVGVDHQPGQLRHPGSGVRVQIAISKASNTSSVRTLVAAHTPRFAY